jgi:hypothetical protein
MTDLYVIDTGKPEIEPLPFDSLPPIRIEDNPGNIDWANFPLALMYPRGSRCPRIKGVWKRNARSFRKEIIV